MIIEFCKNCSSDKQIIAQSVRSTKMRWNWGFGPNEWFAIECLNCHSKYVMSPFQLLLHFTLSAFASMFLAIIWGYLRPLFWIAILVYSALLPLRMNIPRTLLPWKYVGKEWPHSRWRIIIPSWVAEYAGTITGYTVISVFF